MTTKTIDLLINKGVSIAAPASIEIDQGVDPDRISGSNVTIHAGSKLLGSKTLVCEGAELGYEGPATIKNCYVGPNVRLKGGYYENAVFLEGAECGSGAHVRAGTILEEQASIAHTVGLKQTILLPFVTLGSLINFCDCLMAGGTSRKNHSEVGSSYIHFNYTPNQDKATPSLIGDVPRGVMLKQSPIFLGGQGGLVGPCRIAYGTIVAAGSICRKDQMKENQLVIEAGPRTARIPFKAGRFHNLAKILEYNFNYIGNLFALNQWYRVIRGMFIGPRYPEALARGLAATLELAIEERIKQLGRLRDKVQASLGDADAPSTEQKFCDLWTDVQPALIERSAHDGDTQTRDQFVEIIQNQIKSTGNNYIETIQALTLDQAQIGGEWLQSIVDWALAIKIREFDETKG